MPKKRPRFLPTYVTVFTDRHGVKRYRYRRKGYASGYFKHELGTEEFRAEYAAFEEGQIQPGAIGRQHPTNSLADLVTRYMSVATRLGPTKVTQVKVRGILSRFLERYGNGPKGPRYVTDFTFEHIDVILAKERIKRPEGKRMVGGVEAARKLRKELVRLFAYAEKIRMRPPGSNPAKQSDPIRVSASERTDGHHSWTEAEIAQYRDKHPLGTKARLSLELLLWTGQRRGDGYRFGPKDVRDGCFVFRQQKGGKGMMLPLAPQLVTAITAMPPAPADAPCYLLTDYGKPYSYAGFGNAFRAWCNDAGLPHCSAHGLRKANARRLAELGMSNQTLKAVGGWSADAEVALYTAAADQGRLAAQAIEQLSKWEAGMVSNHQCLTANEIDGNPQKS